MKFSFKNKISFLAFIITFVTFLVYVLLEDIFWVDKIINLKNSNTLKLGRILISLSFSLVSAAFVHFGMTMFYKTLSHAARSIVEWDGDSSFMHETSFPADPEIDHLIRSMKLTMFQLRQSAIPDSRNDFAENLKVVSDSIQKFVISRKIQEIAGFDISVIPKEYKSGSNDYINIISLQNNLFGIMAGFQTNDPEKTAYKARIDGIVSAMQFCNPANDPLDIFQRSLRTVKIPKLNLTVFSIHKETKEISYLTFQENDMLICRAGKITSLDKKHSVHYNFDSMNVEIKNVMVKSGDFLVILSDRILHPAGWNPVNLQEKLEKNQIKPKNSRELAIQIYKTIHESNPGIAIEKSLGLITIRIK